MTRRPATRTPPRPELTPHLVLAWADAFHARTGRWPTRDDGTRGLPDGNWSAVDQCLKLGLRGLSPGSSLAKLLRDCRGRRHKGLLPPLTVEAVLAWADEHHRRTGDWPHQLSGPVAAAPGETWGGVNAALDLGRRGLPGGTTLAQVLADRRGVRNHVAPPALTLPQVLGWADAHRAATGGWPTQRSGPVAGVPGETWAAVNTALADGARGLPGRTTLARLLADHRGVRHHADRPRLEVWEVLVWADAHRDRTGAWPTADSGPVADAPGETWSALDTALAEGLRGLPGGDSLARLLARRRGRRNPAAPPLLTAAQVLRWADAHRARTGAWPGKEDGSIVGAEGETWAAVERALRAGRRGLPGGSSLAQLLAAERGVRNPGRLPRLTRAAILGWADGHRARTGRWPTAETPGPIPGTGGETWAAVSVALRAGRRGLRGRTSLARLLAACRGVRNRQALPPLTLAQVLAWAAAHKERTGSRPTVRSGPVVGAPGETWGAVNAALSEGGRGLPGRDTLARLLARS